MAEYSVWRTVAVDERARARERHWRRLCAAYLPHAPAGSMWTYRHATSRDLPESGWKLHVSATILNASQILKRIAPVLVASGVQFKVARSLAEVLRLNSGLLHTYSQIGKVITVYPRNESEAINLAQCLHKLTCRFQAPSVPFDLRFTETSNIYYRYGAFRRIEIEQADGQRGLGMHSPSGELVLDVRERPKPDWVRDPFENVKPVSKRRKPQSDPTRSFHVLRALVQRGKGGVYQAIDLGANPPRLCLLKEGRRHGEMAWDGRDGAWRVRNEERVLSSLSARGMMVPKVYSRFELDGNFYLVMEFIDGESLHNLLLRQTRLLSLRRVSSYGIQIATLLSQMHRAGWAWRDCKPKNLIVTGQGTVVPIDFEGAAPIKRPDPLIWGTPGFIPPQSIDRATQTAVADDLYALGSIMYLLFTGRYFDHAKPGTIKKLRRNVPLELRRLVESLLADEPKRRPTAQAACARLNSVLLSGSNQPIRPGVAQAA